MAVGSIHSAGRASGMRRRITWSVVHATVATVMMPEPLVDHRPARVVDAGDDVVDAEALPGHPGDQDVGVVAAGDRGHGAGLLDAGLDQAVAVEPDALHRPSGEVRAQAVERLGPAVDDGDGVAVLEEGDAERRSDPPAPDDHDVHGGGV